MVRSHPLFLSTLSLRRATEKVPADVFYQAFLSTLSLRRATLEIGKNLTDRKNFYPRSPCGERLKLTGNGSLQFLISIHALLAESDAIRPVQPVQPAEISIHALLAESDNSPIRLHKASYHFYPRSPCGERHCSQKTQEESTIFLSTLSLRRATKSWLSCRAVLLISIHALLAESDLRRLATRARLSNFYPRSPCGERQEGAKAYMVAAGFLSTLSLRRATRRCSQWQHLPCRFLSTLSLRRATKCQTWDVFLQKLFLSTLSLRRATIRDTKHPHKQRNFYPRSPCGERLCPFSLSPVCKLFLSTLSLRRATP